MSKKLLRYSSFKIYILLFTVYCSLFTVLGCAPKVIAPPPLYKDSELSLKEIIKLAQKDINTLKAIVSIDVEKNNVPFTYVDASLLIKKPNWLHMRFYKFGLPAGDFLMKDNTVYAVSGKGSNKFKEFGKELYYSVFWWEDIENAIMYREAENYVIRTKNKEIRLNRNTLLPERQEVIINNKKIYMLYSEPKKEGNLWYPSLLKIEIDAYRFSIKIEKLFINPLLREDDFREPPLYESSTWVVDPTGHRREET